MKILVIGVRKEHFHNIEKQFPRFKFKLMSDQMNHDKFPSIDNFSHIISFWRFTNHNVEKVCNKHKGFVRVRSYSTAIKALTRIQNEHFQ